jgi:hypothetical protein
VVLGINRPYMELYKEREAERGIDRVERVK